MSINDCIEKSTYVMDSCIVDAVNWVAYLAYWAAGLSEGVGANLQGTLIALYKGAS